MGMIRIIMILFMIHLANSQNIYHSVNATDFMQGFAAELNCVFPAEYRFNSVMWYNEDEPIKLRCQTLTTCEQDPRFKVSRSGYNITLIIKHVQLNQTRWICMDDSGLRGASINLKVSNNKNIYYSPTGPDFIEGHAAKLSCDFTFAPKYNSLSWLIVGEAIELKCKTTTTCDQDSRFKLSRSGNRITLVIKHVQPNQTIWKCNAFPRNDPNANGITQTHTINVISGEVDMHITQAHGAWFIKTSCSNPLPKLKCEGNDSEMSLSNPKINKCGSTGLHYIKGFIPYRFSLIRCVATWGTIVLVRYNIYHSTNGTDFMEGDAAELTCFFPADPKFNSLMWRNLDESIDLRCKTPTTCEQDPRFKVSRSGYNITLIIKHVNIYQTNWRCADNSYRYIRSVPFTVIRQ